MKLRSFKTVLFALFTVFLGAGQGVCAAMMSAASDAGIAANTQHGEMLEGHGAAAHDHHQKSDDHKSTPRMPHNNDCGYCVSTHGYKALAKSALSVAVDVPPVVKVVVKDAHLPDPRAGYAQMNRMALISRGQISQTPITLKIRLLI